MPIFSAPDLKGEIQDPRYVGAIDLVRRNGAREVQLRYDDEQHPVVWVAVAGFSIANGKPVARGRINAHQAGGALTPLDAIFALCRACLDRRGVCTHCNRNTMFDESLDFESKPLDAFYCWYQWDPGVQVFRRGCESR